MRSRSNAAWADNSSLRTIVTKNTHAKSASPTSPARWKKWRRARSIGLPVTQNAAPDLPVFRIEQLHAIIFTFQGFEQTPGLGFGHFSFGGRPRFGLLLISLLPVFVFPELGSVLQI